ncbi:sperm flagellar protein 2 [Salarias fasciatus]|uniref:sperm flagellar protein 2 n=1 Tax=Salarias fasciatus TaxID=181472 RepID=UPI001176FE84|nr:sperm flagellar protein 2 [Salarias fasciatus]
MSCLDSNSANNTDRRIMSEILCRWLNQELQLSRVVEPKTLARDFSNGYLIGEVLHKYQLQSDFSLFMKKDTSISKVNNFTRLEPTLKLLGISFNINTAQDLMQEKQGAATHLLYQLYDSLEKKKKAELSGTMMEIMQPAAIAKLHKKEHEIYSDRLHQVVRRDAETKLQKISQHYEEKYQQLNDRPVNHPIQQKRKKVQDEKGMKNTDKATYMQLPRPPPYASHLSLKKRQQQQQLRRKEQQAKVVQDEIAQFETNRRKLVISSFSSSLSSSGHPFPPNDPFGGSSQGCEVPGGETKLILQSNSKYLQEIRQRLEENAVACEQRQKRCDRFLVEQLKAHEAQEEARRDEQLVKRLTRQTRQEQRLAAQLLQIRMQKEVIVKNRLFREQQYQQRREKDFQEALDREAALAQQAKLERAEEIRMELEFCQRMAAERAQGRYKKHFNICKDILEQIVDLATKMGEYRLLTGNLIPEKQMREWKELLFSGLPLYEPETDHQCDTSAPLDPVELNKQEILNNMDYDEYTDMVGEWAWREEAEEMNLPLTNNNILGHVVHRLRSILHPPTIETSPPLFPPFTIKACALGRLCAAQTACLSKTAEGPDTEGRTEHSDEKAMLGAAAAETLRNGSTISNELLVDIIVQAICTRVPAQSGWILIGYPLDVTQAHLLEKALGGSVDLGSGVVDNRTNLAADPNPPKPPPPTAPVLDVALLLDIPDAQVITQAVSQMDTDPAAAAAAATASPTTDQLIYMAQITQRTIDFRDTWPELEEWFGKKQDILVRVDADVKDEELCSRIHSVLQQVMQKKNKAPPTPPAEDAVPENVETPGSSLTASAPVGQSLKEKNVQSVTSLSTTNPHSPKEQLEQSGSASITSESKEDSQTFNKNSSSSATSSQVYMDDPLPPEIPKLLCPYWDAVCESYVNNVKRVMEQLRSQQTLINNHLFNFRGGYKHYLDRPDLKQEIVSHWQKDFNSFQDDLRQDEDTKAELHLRLDELRERLWDISDKRKEENEQEKASLLCDDWLEDQSTCLINHHCVLMQVELNRFQETLCLLRVYYLGMCSQTPPELPSNFVYIPLIDSRGATDQDESTPLVKRPKSSAKGSKTNPVKPHEELVNDYEEAVKAIAKMVSAEAHQMETKEQKESTQEKEEKDKKKESASKSKTKKQKQSSQKQKGPSSPSPASSPTPVEDKTLEKANGQEIKNKILEEYAAALNHEENAAKARIALVKSHGLVMVESLQCRAQECFSAMDEWLQARYLAEMKSIDQLAEVIGHHIEAGMALQNELVWDCSDFYLNGDCHVVQRSPLATNPPSLEKPTLSPSATAHLHSLFQQLCTVAPSESGFMCSSEFFSFLEDLVSADLSKNTLPEIWIDVNEMQLMEIVSSLTNDRNLVDWRRFLLSAALPWPFPSVTQLLDALKHFKEADTEHTGYINEVQYSQTELWFSTENIQTVSEEPSEIVPHDRLADLPKFIFRLFADHTSAPPQLDYVSMLQYFAADSNPRQGFIRALSVVLGQQIKHSSLSHLVKSMPSIEETAELDGDLRKKDALYASTGPLGEQEVSIPALTAVICHSFPKMKESSLTDCPSQEEYTENLTQIFRELGYDSEGGVPFSILSQHPFIQALMEESTQYQLVNIHRILLAHQDEEDNTLTV